MNYDKFCMPLFNYYFFNRKCFHDSSRYLLQFYIFKYNQLVVASSYSFFLLLCTERNHSTAYSKKKIHHKTCSIALSLLFSFAPLVAHCLLNNVLRIIDEDEVTDIPHSSSMLPSDFFPCIFLVFQLQFFLLNFKALKKSVALHTAVLYC